MSTKITPEHLRRRAIIYVRQSTPFQMMHNHESQRRQYGLADHARQLGFGVVDIIDEDLGKTGSGLVERPGFQRLVADVCSGQVGAVFCIEASRLARNGRDWHHLIELCGLVGTLVIDPDGVYNPQVVNDRLLLGLKGTMSEFELNLLRQRSLEAIRQKARRGELQFALPAGFTWTHHGRIEKDPDARVQHAMALVLSKLEELGSARQVLLWCRGEQMMVPVASYDDFGKTVSWRLPVYRTILAILTNPIYAGAYAFGKTGDRTRMLSGRARKTRGHKKPRETWLVLIRDHHPGYITWEQFERNQMIIGENAHSKSSFSRKSGRGGRSLLAGLLRCGHCGRMLHVAYSGNKGNVPRYHCRGGNVNHGVATCISFGGLKVDRRVSEELLNAITTDAIDAAIEHAEQQSQCQNDKRQSLQLQLEQAQYEVRLATRRYESVDPDNRLVAKELESRWNVALERQRELEVSLEKLDTEIAAVPAVSRAALVCLADHLPDLWHAETTDMRLKQRIVRILITEIVANIDRDSREVILTIHWTGGRHSAMRLPLNRTGHHSRCTSLDAVNVIRQMAGLYSDAQIAATLNRLGLHTGHGNTWKEHRVRSARHHWNLATYEPGNKNASMLTMDQVAERLDICHKSVRRLIRRGLLPASQIVPMAPWEIPAVALSSPALTEAVRRIKSGARTPQERQKENEGSLFSEMWRGGAE